jgi:AcrR family transcriptional regulator
MTVGKSRKCGAGGRPPAHEVEGRRQNLIAVATSLFQVNGYEATSLEKIAKVAGASKTTIYRNFGDKSDLFRTVLNRFVEPIWPKLSDVSIEGKSLREGLVTFGHLLVSPAVVNPEAIALLRLVYRESWRFPELARIFDEIEKTTIVVVANYLSVAMRQKSLRQTDATWAAGQFVELIWGALVRRLVMGTVSFPDESERQHIVESAVALFLNGLSVLANASAFTMDQA